MNFELIFASVGGMLLVVLAIGTPIAVALGFVGVVGLFIFMGGNATNLIGHITFASADNFILTAIPLFVLMGNILTRCGLGRRLFEGLSGVFIGVPGGLIHTNIASCAIFAAMSGSSMATAAAIGSAALPELEKRGYNMEIAVGSIAAAGTLGPMIPPSVAMIIYGSLTGVSVGKLYLAGLLPGITLAIMFSMYIGLRSVILKDVMGRAPTKLSLREKVVGLFRIWHSLLLISIIMGTIYLGVCTPTEGGAIGAVGAIIISAALRELTWKNFWEAVNDTLLTTSMILFIIAGASIFSATLANLGMGYKIKQMVKELRLSPSMIFLAIAALFVLWGWFSDCIPLMVALTPTIFPVIVDAGFDPVWFGICMVLWLEMDAITPPIGVNLFVIQGMSKYPFTTVFRGALPFFYIMVSFQLLLYFVPEIALFLPRFLAF